MTKPCRARAAAAGPRIRRSPGEPYAPSVNAAQGPGVRADARAAGAGAVPTHIVPARGPG
ncbi:hypothetical protein [Spongiactinospora gelatinilytica]|uniref:hypothetical protein n=1 Tax=Spongiactinospora gelatinilytica TaxID=2666298 RepID=UPI0011B94891|nr:hypothetical protein [Spongiactinospora gelatinilytica]